MLPKHIELHNVQVFDALSQETVAFAAELHLHGRRVASIRNDGAGGSHVVQFDAPLHREAFNETVTAWAQSNGVQLEPTDRLINALLDQHEIAAAARAFARESHISEVVCVRKTPVRLDSEPSGYPLGWEETYLLPVPDDSSAADIASREGADAYLSYTFA